MKRVLFAVPLLALATTIALAQANSPQQTSPDQNKPGQNPINPAPTQANPSPTTPDPTAPTTEKSVPPPQGQQPKGQSPLLPQGSAPLPSSNVADSASLREQLNQAYQSEPSLSGSSIQIEVTDTAIQLSGTVPTGKEKTTAKRIAQSYAGDRKVTDKMTVSGRGDAANTTKPPKQ